MFVTDALGNPYEEQDLLPAIFGPIARARQQANEIKRQEPITVVIGNPPYKEKAKGRGGWVESGNAVESAPLAAWMPPPEWGLGAHAKHLRNLSVYFWRWATCKVFDHDPSANTGIVCIITVASFLNGPGFEKMRDYLRRTTDDLWVIDCSPEGHQPAVNTRIFEAVQQPVCIVLASRSPSTDRRGPATVRYRSLPAGHRRDKFDALGSLTLDTDGELFARGVEFGREVIWLQTFGERYTDPSRGRPAGPPRLAPDDAPSIPVSGAISSDPAEMPDTIGYDAANRRLLVGSGYVEGVDPRVWDYEVSGKRVLRQWFSYRKANRERPVIGDKRPPSRLGEIQPDHWLSGYTTELINVLNVLGRLVDLESEQAELLEQICAAPTISADELRQAGALAAQSDLKQGGAAGGSSEQASLL